MEADDLNRLGFELEHIQVFIILVTEENGAENFFGLHQASLYVTLYWCIAQFEEAHNLKIYQVLRRGACFKFQIQKWKINQDKKLQYCIAPPNSLEYLGNFWPVNILEVYMSARK